MISELAPYSKYQKETHWFGAVPEAWRVVPNRTIFMEIKDRGHVHEQMLSVTISQGVIKQAELLANSTKKDSSNEDKEKYKLVCPGDYTYNKMRAWQGAGGLSQFRGIVSPAYIVLRPRQQQEMRYFHYLFRTAIFAKEAERWSYGISSDQWSLRIEDFKRMYVCVPPIEEQTSIVRFLDYLDKLVKRSIRAKRKLIDQLNAQKSAIINQAVTKGLNPKVEFKDSGIKWLGEIPKHWSVSRVKRLAKNGSKTFTDGDWIETPFITNSGVRLLQTGNVGIGVFKEKGFRFISETTFSEFNCTEVCPNDVLICRLDGPVGRACLAPDLGVKCITSVDNTIVKTHENIDPQYVVYVMSSPSWLDWLSAICRAGGGFRYRVSRTMLGDEKIPIPPIEEQRQISQHLNSSLETIERLIKSTVAVIEHLKEYRDRVIIDVVTGKLDVRAAATNFAELNDLNLEEEMFEQEDEDTESAEVAEALA